MSALASWSVGCVMPFMTCLHRIMQVAVRRGVSQPLKEAEEPEAWATGVGGRPSMNTTYEPQYIQILMRCNPLCALSVLCLHAA
jgi:hypothetical protein